MGQLRIYRKRIRMHMFVWLLFSYLRYPDLKLFIQGHRYNADVIHVRRNLVHAVCWRCDENLIFAWDTKNSHQKVDGFITPYAYENLVGIAPSGNW